jgi:hypothetical protein
MSFANIENFDTNAPERKRLEYMDTKAGNHIIRILEPSAKDWWTHYINRISVKCLGEECPLCTRNFELIRQFPDTFRQQLGFVNRTKRYYINVLDKTPAKVCVACGAEYKRKLDVCECGQVLSAEMTPLNKVKILAKGVTLFEDLNNINNAIRDEQGEVIGIHNYDVGLIVTGTGKDTKTTPVADKTLNTPVDMSSIELFDTSNALIELRPDEMLELQRGVSLTDIFAARKASENTAEVSATVAQGIENEIDKLFGTQQI